jgi:hypothetical protein
MQDVPGTFQISPSTSPPAGSDTKEEGESDVGGDVDEPDNNSE